MVESYNWPEEPSEVQTPVAEMSRALEKAEPAPKGILVQMGKDALQVSRVVFSWLSPLVFSMAGLTYWLSGFTATAGGLVGNILLFGLCTNSHSVLVYDRLFKTKITPLRLLFKTVTLPITAPIFWYNSTKEKLRD